MNLVKSNSNKIIGILGGMGPSAGLTLHQKIIDNTKAIKDQDHFSIVHLSYSSIIGDRSDYIRKLSNINPANSAIQAADSMYHSIRMKNINKIILGIPCNTFHSPVIFNKFKNTLNKKYDGSFQIINMVEETIKYLKKNHPNENIGLLSTLGTVESNVYNSIVDDYKLNVNYLNNDMIQIINKAIYNQFWGIKVKNNPVDNKVKFLIKDAIEYYKQNNVNNIILGCSEIPLAIHDLDLDGINFIDPVEILSKRMIQEIY